MTTTHKVIRATYSHDEEFKIPIGVDLNDKSQVASWGIKWNILWITYADDGREEEIEGEGWIHDFDYKRPESVVVVVVDDDGDEVVEDDEDVAVAVEEKCEGCGITSKDEDTGLGLSTLATTNQLLCPTCIPAEEGEDEDDGPMPCYKCGVRFVLNSNTVGCVCDDCDNNDDEDEDEDEDDDCPEYKGWVVCDVCDETLPPDAMHSVDCKGSRVRVDSICDNCLGQALDDRTIESYSESDDEEDDEHYRWI